MPVHDYIAESKSINIKDKVFVFDSIKELGNIIWVEFEKDRKADPLSKNIKIEFIVKCFDNSMFKSESVNILSNDSPILKRNIKSIRIRFQSGPYKHIYLFIKHGNKDSYIDILGYQDLWVDGMIGKFNHVLNASTDQNIWVKRNMKAIGFVLFIVGSLTTGFIFDFLNRNSKNFTPYWNLTKNNVDDAIGKVIIACFLGSFFWLVSANYINNLIPELWPSVEMNIGPEFKQTERKKRKFYAIIITLILLPILTNIITAILLGR